MKQGLILAAVAAVLNLGLVVPAASPIVELLQYDRVAIERGEVWRLTTGNWVHWSTGHFAVDLLALFFAAALLGRGSALLVVTSSFLIGAVLYGVSPHVTLFRGLSGPACALTVAAAVHQWQKYRSWMDITLLLVLAGKLAYEVASGSFLFASMGLGDMGFPIPLAHLVGAVTGLWLPIMPPFEQPQKIWEVIS